MQEKRKRGHPKRFKSGEELLELFQEFCRYVEEERGYAITPSQTNFCRYLAEREKPVTVRTIYASLHEYFPIIKKEYQLLVSDLLSQGAMTGHYNPTMAIFTLKNWCDWKDKRETEIGNKDGKPFALLSEEEAKKALEALGYVGR